MDTLTSLRAFTTVAELRSFTAAAEQLGLSTAMVSKHVKALERRVSARLLHRTSRSVSLSEAGERYLARVRGLLDELNEVESEISATAAEPRGTLKVSLPVWLANPAFARGLAAFHIRYPQIQLDLNVSARMVNLVEEGFDLALRGTFTPSEGLVARQLMSVPFHLVAAPALLARVGTPATWQALQGQPLVAYSPVMADGRITLPLGGESHELRFTPILRSDNETLLVQAARAGMGFMFAPEPLLVEDLASGTLQRVLPEIIDPRVPLYAVYASRRHLPAKLRVFLDFVGKGGE